MITMPDRLENQEFWCPDCDKFLTEDQVEVEPDNQGHWDGLTFITFCGKCAAVVSVEQDLDND